MMLEMSARNRRRYSAAALVAGLLLSLVPIHGGIGWGATAAATGQPSATATPPAPIPGDSSVLSFLGDVINWSRDLNLEDQVVEQPSDLLYFSQNRSQAARVVSVAFDFARAEAAVLAAIGNPGPTGAPEALPRADMIRNFRLKLEAAVKTATELVETRKAQLAAAPQPKRQALAEQVAGAQADLELAQARLDFFTSIGEFEKSGTEAAGTHSGLLGRIDELQQSVPQKEASAISSATVPKQAAEPSGLFAHVKHLIALQRSEDVLRQRIEATDQLLRRSQEFYQSIDRLHQQIDARVQTLAGQAASGADGDSTALKKRKRELDLLLAEHTQVAKALPPLGAEAVLLRRYASNLGQWLRDLKQRSVEELRSLAARLIGIALVLGAIFAGASLWRKLTFRYVHDPDRRHQLLQIRTFAVALLIALVLLFNFISELAALATIMGLAAAGIALALQNVILSLAGHFYLSGRFGLRVGDRVELGGVRGDVINLGLVKLTLMELAGEGGSRQPTGRVVVMPNSIVFQPNVNFSKQAPGSNFMWNEVRLTLSLDCDYQLAETRLMEVIGQIFDRYREAVHRQCRAMERHLHVQIEPPTPQSRLRLSQAGIEMVIRYPVEARSAPQVADEVSRRLLDAINREPSLRLVTLGTPTIQASGAPVAGEEPVKEKGEASPRP